MNDRAEPALASASRSSRTWLRRLLPPTIVLVTAVAVLLYGQRQREQQMEDVRLAAQQLCEQVAAMSPGGALPPMARQLHASLTSVQQLHTIITEYDPTLATLAITIETGDTPRPYGDGSATHQAHVQLAGSTRLVLRFYHPGAAQNLRLIGYWTP